jgi:hypothetical protein
MYDLIGFSVFRYSFTQESEYVKLHIVVVEDDEGLRGVLRTWMLETGCVATGCDKLKTYDGIDILVIGPNASQMDMKTVEDKHIPFVRIGFSPDMDAVMRWIENIQKDISDRVERSILEDRAV